MPIFEYRCKRCGHVTVFLEKAGAAGDHPCEKCGWAATEKIISTFAPQSGEPARPSCPKSDSCPSGTCPYAR